MCCCSDESSPRWKTASIARLRTRFADDLNQQSFASDCSRQRSVAYLLTVKFL